MMVTVVTGHGDTSVIWVMGSDCANAGAYAV